MPPWPYFVFHIMFGPYSGRMRPVPLSMSISMGIYRELGVKRIINCVSTTSPLGSSVTYPEVMEAMKEASTHYVAMDQLRRRQGQ